MANAETGNHTSPEKLRKRTQRKVIELVTFGESRSERKNPIRNIGIHSIQGQRKYMEDRYKEIQNFRGKANETFLAVYDGHTTGLVADYAAHHLHERLENNLDMPYYTNSGRLRETFMQIDQEVLQLGIEGGSTATVLFIQGENLSIANVGDSHAVLDRGGRALCLTRDHKLLDPREWYRVEQAGGTIAFKENFFRIFPPKSGPDFSYGINMARSLGDHEFGNNIVTALPDTKKIRLKNKDRKLIIASDGIWDVISDQEAVDLIKDITDPNEAAQKLTQEALSRGSGDNITALVAYMFRNQS